MFQQIFSVELDNLFNVFLIDYVGIDKMEIELVDIIYGITYYIEVSGETYHNILTSLECHFPPTFFRKIFLKADSRYSCFVSMYDEPDMTETITLTIRYSNNSLDDVGVELVLNKVLEA